MPELKRVCVFWGSNRGTAPSFAAAAVSLGTALAERNMELVNGGASVRLMGVTADAVLAAGGQVTGVITESLSDHEIGHRRPGPSRRGPHHA
jgi:predicted Rossmann-fold nucleotide-binding protein